MRIPFSTKTLFRLHRNFFMFRTPRKPFQSEYSLSFSPGGKEPLVCFRVEKKRPPLIAVFLCVAVVLSALLISRKE